MFRTCITECLYKNYQAVHLHNRHTKNPKKRSNACQARSQSPNSVLSKNPYPTFCPSNIHALLFTNHSPYFSSASFSFFPHPFLFFVLNIQLQ